MKRKRFIKLLMWAGMSRNDAAMCAELAKNAGRPYLYVLGDLLNFHRPQFKNMALAWLKVRYTIIHGYNTRTCRFFADIDEVHTWPADVVLYPTFCTGPDGKARIIEVSICKAGGGA